jgi:UDP-N-acetylmuramoyl-tripeptide--D-alanyl-D-alanine ligase
VAPAALPWLESWQRASASRRWVTFGLDADAQVTAHSIETSAAGTSFTLVTPDGSARVEMRLLGRHNVVNALAAAAAAWGLGVAPDSIARGLALVRPSAGRLVPQRLVSGALLLDWLVLGDLGELGPEAAEWHRRVGRDARAAGVTRLYALGALAAEAADAFGEGGLAATDVESLAAQVRAQLATGTVVVVKGSRSAHMERVAAALLEEDG